ncbi:MAG: heat-inducible transcriptional repressor HrcA [Elusimicrobiota bacterium]
MRQLDPQVAEERKRKVLRWVVHNYIRTSQPIASSIIAEAAGMDLSSASIRGILKELEDEGYLYQPHTSSGRVPTDRGYRIYVDYLQDAQRLASEEKARIESLTQGHIDELDHILAQTSRLLSHVSHQAGVVLSPRLERQQVRRLELIPLGGMRVLAVVVTQSGQVRHWPLELPAVPSAHRVQMLSRFLNERLRDKSVHELRQELTGRIEAAMQELREMQGLADQLLDVLGSSVEVEPVFLDGAASLMEGAEDLGSLEQIHSLMCVVEERRTLAKLLEEDLRGRLRLDDPKQRRKVRVRIGEENTVPEFRNLSLVTTAYELGDRTVGVLGILGPKRMEYSKMFSLVDYMSHVVGRALGAWEGDWEDDEPKRKR